MSNLNFATVGETLKKARESKLLTIDQVRKQIRVHTDVLYALEENRGEEILSSTYIKSFLKIYAKFLGLDPDDILKQYASMKDGTFANVVPIPSQPQKKTIEKKVVEKKTVPAPNTQIIKSLTTGLVVILSIALVAVITYFSIKIVQKIKKSDVIKNISTTVRQKKVKAAKPAAKATTLKDIQSKKGETESFVTPKGMPIYLALTAKQAVLVKAKKDGITLFERVLEKGAVESFKANDRIELYLGKAEAVGLRLNGKSLGSPGKGVIKHLEITRKGIRIR